jgi:hypothetical protein
VFEVKTEAAYGGGEVLEKTGCLWMPGRFLLFSE